MPWLISIFVIISAKFILTRRLVMSIKLLAGPEFKNPQLRAAWDQHQANLWVTACEVIPKMHPGIKDAKKAVKLAEEHLLKGAMQTLATKFAEDIDFGSKVFQRVSINL
jgi:hypothetical protein